MKVFWSWTILKLEMKRPVDCAHFQQCSMFCYSIECNDLLFKLQLSVSQYHQSNGMDSTKKHRNILFNLNGVVFKCWRTLGRHQEIAIDKYCWEPRSIRRKRKWRQWKQDAIIERFLRNSTIFHKYSQWKRFRSILWPVRGSLYFLPVRGSLYSYRSVDPYIY